MYKNSKRNKAIRVSQILLILGLVSCGENNSDLSEAEARLVVESYWVSTHSACTVLGRLEVIRRGHRQTGTNQIPEYYLDKLEALARIGVLEKVEDTALTRPTQRGGQRIVEFAPGPRIGEFGELEDGPDGTKCVRHDQAVLKVTDIIRNDSVENSLDPQRVVYGKYLVEPGALIVLSEEAQGRDATSFEKKFRALLVFDPFKEEWVVSEMDVGAVQGDFNSEDVPAALE